MDASYYHSASAADNRLVGVAFFYPATRRGGCYLDIFGVVRASLWRTPARSGRRSLRLLARGISQVLSPWLAYSDASAADNGHRVGGSRRHFDRLFGFHHPRSNICTKSFLMEGQT
jgi:hypothetical protein